MLVWGRPEGDRVKLLQHATYDVRIFALLVLFCLLPGRRSPGESPMWIAQTIGIEAFVGITLAAGKSDITFSLTFSTPFCPSGRSLL